MFARIRLNAPAQLDFEKQGKTRKTGKKVFICIFCFLSVFLTSITIHRELLTDFRGQ
jgi:hypothetical protein